MSCRLIVTYFSGLAVKNAQDSVGRLGRRSDLAAFKVLSDCEHNSDIRAGHLDRHHGPGPADDYSTIFVFHLLSAVCLKDLH